MVTRHVQTVQARSPALRKVAVPVDDFEGPLRRLCCFMLNVFETYEAIGLAANQVGDPRAVALIACPGIEPFFITNPQIIDSGPDMLRQHEGCLSLPGYEVPVLRYSKITVQYQDLTGAVVRVEARDLLARIYQHEIDHLNGRLIHDYLNVVEKERFRTVLKKDRRQQLERQNVDHPRSPLPARKDPLAPGDKGRSR